METEKSNTSVLTDRQKVFCKEYIIDFNATQAAIRAGYSQKGARTTASDTLAKAYIQDEVRRLMADRSKKLNIDAEMVLKELAAIGFSDLSNYMSDGYTLKNLSVIKEHSKAIQSVEINTFETETGVSKTVKFRLYDKLAALEKIAKHIGFFEKDNNQKGERILIPPTPERLAEIKKLLEGDC